MTVSTSRIDAWLGGQTSEAVPDEVAGLAAACASLASALGPEARVLAGPLSESPLAAVAANRLLDMEPESLRRWSATPGWAGRFVRIAAQSSLYGRWCVRQPELALCDPQFIAAADAAVDAAITACASSRSVDVGAVSRALALRRRAWVVDILDAEVTGRRTMTESCERITLLAERSLSAALEAVLAADPGLKRLRIAVLGMGKLGSNELNLSSDIDLIVLYDPIEPQPDDVEQAASVVKAFTALLEARVDAQPTWRVDHRLRPFGTQGALAWRRDHALGYYERHGRPWERVALLRARPVAGDHGVGHRFLGQVRPFVFRRNLDPAALEEIVAMKASIDAELRRRDATRGSGIVDVKLGEGGIREVEFLAQALLLVWGGRIGAEFAPPTIASLRKLVAHGLLPDGDAEVLVRAWSMLRRVEHRLQMDEERQTHEIHPGPPRDRLAARLGYTSTEAFVAALDEQRALVRAAWLRLFADARYSEVSAGVDWVAQATAAASRSEPEATALLAARGFRYPARAAATLARAAATADPLVGPNAAVASRQVGERLVELASRSTLPDAALERLHDIVVSASGRAALVRVCASQPVGAQLLVTLLGTSESLARLAAREPRMLEALLTPSPEPIDRTDVAPADALFEAAAAPHANGEVAGLEQRQERLRRWRAIEESRAVLALLSGAVTARAFCARLSRLAGAMVEVCRREALLEAGAPADAVCALALGKLGGRELGAGGDLDLVFISGPDTGGLDVARVVRRWIALLSAPLRFGRLYEVDTRLRPDGSSGTVVSTVPALEDYYVSRAWGYERVALCRARSLEAGGELSRSAEAAIDRAWLSGDVEATLANMWSVRDKRLVQAEPGQRYKLAPGGLMDLELTLHAVQMRAIAAGAWGEARTSNAWEILEHLERAGLWSPAAVARVGASLDLLRHTEIWSRLVDASAQDLLPRDDRRAVVAARVDAAFPNGPRQGLEARLGAAQRGVLDVLEKVRQGALHYDPSHALEVP